MAGIDTAARKAKVGAEQAMAKSEPWVEFAARCGYVVRGVLYIVVGVLAVQLVLDAGGETTGQSGAIAAIGEQPFGTFLLVLVALGLVGYSLWGFVRAIFDPLGRGSDAKGIAQRVGYVVSGIAYGLLLIPTIQIVMGAGSNGEDTGARDATAGLMSQPFGPWLVGVIGVIGMAGGVGQIYTGVKADFKKDLKTGQMSTGEKKLATVAGTIGMAARGLIFMMLGFFLVQAARSSDPNQAQGLDGALQILVEQPYGTYLLGIVAAGLVCFGVYSILCARWNRVSRS